MVWFIVALVTIALVLFVHCGFSLFETFRKNKLYEIVATTESDEISPLTRALDSDIISYSLHRTAKRGGREFVFHIYTYSRAECRHVKKLLRKNRTKYTIKNV